MNVRPEYSGPQHAPWLTIAILVAVYVVLVISVWWGRFHRDDIERQRRVKHNAYMAEIRRHCREQDEVAEREYGPSSAVGNEITDWMPQRSRDSDEAD